MSPRGARTAAAALAAVAALGLAGCSEASPELRVSGAYVPEPVDGRMAGGFLTVHNSGEGADRLTSVSSPDAGKVALHTTEDGRMERVESLPVPAGGKLELRRGGNHLMLTELSGKPVEGERVQLVLHFEESDPIEVEVPVESATHVPDAQRK